MEWVLIIGAIVIAVPVLAIALASRIERKNTAIKQEKSNTYAAEINTIKQDLLSRTGTASFPILSAPEHGYRPVAKENLLAVQDGVTRMEMKSTGSYKTRGTSLSIPIVKGVRYRVGSGSIRAEKRWQATAKGRLLVTDRAIVFEADDRNERITWTQISSIDVLTDGMVIAKRSGPPRRYAISEPDPKFAAIVELMLAQTN